MPPGFICQPDSSFSVSPRAARTANPEADCSPARSNMRLLITLVRAGRQQATAVQDGLVQLAQNGLQLLFLDPQEGYLQLAAELLEAASDSQVSSPLAPKALFHAD